PETRDCARRTTSTPLPRKFTPNPQPRIANYESRKGRPRRDSRFASLRLGLARLLVFRLHRLGREHPDLEGGLHLAVKVDHDLVGADLLDGLGDLDGLGFDLEALVLEGVGDHAGGDGAVEE